MKPKNEKEFRVLIAGADLDFKPQTFDDPKVLGRQIAERAGGFPAEEHIVLALLPSGDIEDIRPDETFDLRGRGAEKVIVEKADQTHRFKIDHRDLEWPHACISGGVIRKLAGIDSKYAIYLEKRGEHDRKLSDTDIVNLDEKGVERFITVIDETTEGREALPSADREYLDDRACPNEVIEDGGRTGVILKEWRLPEGLFDHDVADVLVLLPSGYPDCAPDMFYTSPELRLNATGAKPRATQVQETFAGRTWQRWSRHNHAWRPGVDGLRTMVARVQTALEGACS